MFYLNWRKKCTHIDIIVITTTITIMVFHIIEGGMMMIAIHIDIIITGIDTDIMITGNC